MLFGCFIQNKGWEYLSEYVLGFHKKLCTLNKCVHYIGFDWVQVLVQVFFTCILVYHQRYFGC